MAIVISTESGRYMPIPTVSAGKVKSRRFSHVSTATSTTPSPAPISTMRQGNALWTMPLAIWVIRAACGAAMALAAS